MLFSFGVVPSVFDEEEASVIFEVLGAREKARVKFIDEV